MFTQNFEQEEEDYSLSSRKGREEERFSSSGGKLFLKRKRNRKGVEKSNEQKNRLKNKRNISKAVGKKMGNL